MLSVLPPGMMLQCEIRWEDVFRQWELNEATLDHWRQCYTERGFSSWKEWRMHYANAIGLPGLKWRFYAVYNAPLVIPTFFRGAPYRGWVANAYGGETMPTFEKIARSAFVREHAGIQKIIDRFPAFTAIIGLCTSKGIVVIEGMHRCSAIALAVARNIKIKTTMCLYMADLTEEQEKFLPRLTVLSPNKPT